MAGLLGRSSELQCIISTFMVERGWAELAWLSPMQRNSVSAIALRVEVILSFQNPPSLGRIISPRHRRRATAIRFGEDGSTDRLACVWRMVRRGCTDHDNAWGHAGAFMEPAGTERGRRPYT